MDRQRCSPTAGAQHRDSSHARAPILRSVPDTQSSKVRTMTKENQRSRAKRGGNHDGVWRSGPPRHWRQRERRGNRAERDIACQPDGDDEQRRGDTGRDRRKNAEDPGRDGHTLSAVELQPHRIDVADDGRCAGRGRRSDAPPAARFTMRTAAAPLATSSSMTATARHVPVVRSTFAAPTLPLPATRTSMPARLASEKGERHRSSEVAEQHGKHDSPTVMVSAGAPRTLAPLGERRLRNTVTCVARHRPATAGVVLQQLPKDARGSRARDVLHPSNRQMRRVRRDVRLQTQRLQAARRVPSATERRPSSLRAPQARILSARRKAETTEPADFDIEGGSSNGTIESVQNVIGTAGPQPRR